MGDLVTVTEAADRLGVDKSTVSRQVAQTDLKDPRTNKFDFDDFLAWRDDNLNGNKRRNRAAAPEDDLAGDDPLDEPDDGEVSAPPRQQNTAAQSLTKASAAQKAIQAQLSNVRLQRELGRLVDKNEIEQAEFDAGRQLRDGLKTVAADIADEVAAMTEPRQVRMRIEAALFDKFEEIIHELHSTAEHDA